jgi:hypothetical protein
MLRHCAALLLAAAGLAACGLFQRGDDRVITGSGRVTQEARAVSGFERVVLAGAGDILLTQGAAEGLTIEAEDNLLPLIVTDVSDGVLRLGFDRPTWLTTIRPTQPIRYLLTVRDLTAVDIAGNGSLTAGSLSAEDFTLNLSGQGDVTLDHLEAQRLAVRLDGSGTFTLAGRAEEQDLVLTGSGTYAAGDLESQRATVEVSGRGDVVLWVRQDLAVHISGTGSVSYFGVPTLSRRDISGSGDINPMGEK